MLCIDSASVIQTGRRVEKWCGCSKFKWGSRHTLPALHCTFTFTYDSIAVRYWLGNCGISSGYTYLYSTRSHLAVFGFVDSGQDQSSYRRPNKTPRMRDSADDEISSRAVTYIFSNPQNPTKLNPEPSPVPAFSFPDSSLVAWSHRVEAKEDEEKCEIGDPSSCECCWDVVLFISTFPNQNIGHAERSLHFLLMQSLMHVLF